jgi:hypothetical protein
VSVPGGARKAEWARSSLRLTAAALVLLLVCAVFATRAARLPWFGPAAWVALGFVALVAAVLVLVALVVAWQGRGEGRIASAMAGVAATVDMLALVTVGFVVLGVADVLLRSRH